MSKKNNKKSKNINRKNYKIESLEPRLMMDASANDWIHEVDAAFDLSATTSINSSTNAYKNWLNTNIQTLFVEDSVKGQRIAKVSDLIDNDKNALDWLLFVDTNGTHDDLKEIMSSAVNSLKSDYTNFCIQNDNAYKKLRDGSANGTEKIALLLKLNAQVQNYFNTKMISTSELLPLLNSSPKNTKYTFRQGADSDEIWVDVLEGKHRTSTNGLSANLAGFSGVATNLLPIVTDYARSYTLKLDGQGKVVLDNPSIAVASSFRQYTEQDVKNESDPNNKEKLEESRNSNGHVLEFKSIADDDDSATDYYMGLGLSAAGVHELVIGDLDFQVSEPSKIAGLTSTGKIKYLYDNNSRTWKWIGANDVDKVEHASMGLILQKLSELSLWLSKNSTVTPENPIPLLYDSFAGTINRNATENANLSAFLDGLLNTPPTSLQELYEKMCANNRITLNGNSLSLAFSLSVPASVQNVSVAVEELTKLGFDVTRNESLSLVSNPKLDFTLNVDLSAQIRADENTDLKDSVAAIEYTEFFGKETVSVDNPFAITGLLQIGFVGFLIVGS